MRSYIVECIVDGDTEHITVMAESEEDAKNIVEQDNWDIEEIVDVYERSI